ncbi:tyrosine-type recombinase/integrase [bacterium]|nr:tyrosine-type recombinase/integrase [bacterium]
MALYLRGKTWWVKYTVNGLSFRESTGVKGRSNKDAARIREGDILRDAALRTAGANTRRVTRETPPLDLVEQYKAELVRRGRTEEHAEKTAYRIRRLLQGIERVEHVTPERIRAALSRVTEAGDTREGHEPKPLSPKTANDFRACEQLGKLLAAEIPTERRVCYLLAATTGLRRSELRALRWHMVDLVTATVTLPARDAKNRRPVALPLRKEVVEALRSFRGKAEAEAPVFAAVPVTPTFYSDLVTAGIIENEAAHETAEGVLDFHGLRVTFATSLARADVPLALAQKLMRHSTPMLTANVYTKLELHDGRAAVARIDTGTRPSPVEARATGTDGKPPQEGHKSGHTRTEGAPNSMSRAALRMTPRGFEPLPEA